MPPKPLMAGGCVTLAVFAVVRMVWRRVRMSSRPVKKGLRGKGTFHTCEGEGVCFGGINAGGVGFNAPVEIFFCCASTALRMPLATLSSASSILGQVEMGLPSVGKACSLAKGVCFQSTGRTIIGMTQASPALCLRMAFLNSTLQQYSEEM